MLMSNKGGRASQQGQGSTGAPGEPETCKNCHNGNIVVELKMYVIDGKDTVKSYEPGKSYFIDVVVNPLSGPTPKAYGFQITGLIAALNKTGVNIKTISAVSANSKTATADNGRLYAEHNGVTPANTFRIAWIAPPVGTGAVSFYTAGNGVNANNSESGDGSNKTSKQLDEKISTSVVDQAFSDYKIFPNPGTGNFYVSANSNEGVNKINVLNILGKQILKLNFQSGMNLDLNSMHDGIYLVQFLNAENQVLRTQKILKRSERP